MKLRRILAVWAAKCAEKVSVHVFHRQGVTWAGRIALKICPNILSELAGQVREHIFIVCGTNGKTTTNNMLCAALEAEGKKVVCIVSGGNIDVTSLNRVITRGLVKNGRDCTVTVILSDKPGQLSKVCSVIGDLGANILAVEHKRNSSNTEINGCKLHIEMETRNQEHIEQVKKGLRDAGFQVEN